MIRTTEKQNTIEVEAWQKAGGQDSDITAKLDTEADVLKISKKIVVKLCAEVKQMHPDNRITSIQAA